MTQPLEGASEGQRRELKKLRLDLGPTVLDALEDPQTVEVMLNADGRLWQERLGEGMREVGRMDPWQAEALIRGVAACLKTTVTWERPLIEGELPLDGSRFAAQLPPVVSSPTFAIRKRASSVYTLDEYVAAGILTPGHRAILGDAIRQHRNILVSGSTGAGKTTLLNALGAETSRQCPHERIVIIEDTLELQCSSPNRVQFHTSAEVSMTKLLRTTLRMRPDRILVGEVRGPEALDLLMSWNTGHEGGLATVHANNARSALTRLEMLVSMHPEAPHPIAPLIGEAVHLIVHIARADGIGRRVREVLAVEGHGPSGYKLQPL
ncbi:MAG TPA: P-type conjugative transfer ATPase TrbB [Chthoniobacterales bacterium]